MAKIEPFNRSGFYVYRVRYNTGDGRVKEVYLLGAIADVPGTLPQEPLCVEHLLFIFDKALPEKSVLEEAAAGEPTLEHIQGETLHRLYAVSDEDVAGRIRSAFKKPRFCHQAKRTRKKAHKRPVWISNLASHGWAFSTSAAFPPLPDAKKLLKNLEAKLHIKEYPFRNAAERDRAEEDFLEDLRFESVTSGVLGLVMPEKKAYFLLMTEDDSDPLDTFNAAAEIPSIKGERILARTAIRTAEEKKKTAVLIPAPLRRDVLALAETGATGIPEFPLCFRPLSEMLWFAGE
jgi:hypothetical protein